MKLHAKTRALAFCTLSLCLLQAQERAPQPDAEREARLLSRMHSISSHTLLGYVEELASEKYRGRLTGTPGYEEAARWAADLFARWQIKPAGDGGSYFQRFPNPYTLVLPGASLSLQIPVGDRGAINKDYVFEQDFFPGSTSDSGTVEADVVYAGYGITAPELEYDEYGGLDVNGKIVLIEPEVPVSPDQDPERFRKWRPYSFHDYKVRNAKAHGAAGMVYNYHIVNPNAVFVRGLILTYIGRNVVEDLFSGTGRKHDDVVQSIRANLKPASFSTRKMLKIRNVTEHHPEGIGSNVLGCLQGSDATLNQEAVIIGAHIDHVGMNHELMPGAHDNASGVAVLLGAAQALASVRSDLKRTVIFILFGAEEQGVKGSEYYLAHPFVPNRRIKAFINLESVGRGDRISAGGGKNYPQLWTVIDSVNGRFIHRPLAAGFTPNLARPRQDAAHFMWADVPTLSFGTVGEKPLPYATYHTTRDRPETLTPEIMEDLARLVFLSVAEYSVRP